MAGGPSPRADTGTDKWMLNRHVYRDPGSLPIGAVQKLAAQIFPTALPYLRDHPLTFQGVHPGRQSQPRTILDDKGTREQGNYAYVKDQTRKAFQKRPSAIPSVYVSGNMANDAASPVPQARAEAVRALLHEWAHVYRDPRATNYSRNPAPFESGRKLTEGMADAFSHAVSPAALQRLGLDPKLGRGQFGYYWLAAQTDKLNPERYMRKQFGFQNLPQRRGGL